MTFRFWFLILLDVTKYSRRVYHNPNLRRHVYIVAHVRSGECFTLAYTFIKALLAFNNSNDNITLNCKKAKVTHNLHPKILFCKQHFRWIIYNVY